ncbi:MAG: response regulator [bacterium]|nr:response regulator [bacterium]
MIKVLAIDDQYDNLAIIQMSLHLEGFEVITCDNGREGIEKAELEQPDIILLDMMMPYMDGFEVYQQLKKKKTTKNIPVIMLTAVDQPQHMEKAKKMGMEDYITKPFDPLNLATRIRYFLDKAKKQT